MSFLRRTLASVALAATPFVSSPLFAQKTAKAQIEAGDQDYYKARNAASAKTHYQAAVALEPKNVEALWKASAVTVALGEFNASKDKQATLYDEGVALARQALAVDSNNADALFSLANALGRTALTKTEIERSRYVNEIYQSASRCVAINPKHAECLHALGVWHAQAMAVEPGLRSMAISMLGLTVLEKANWNDAQRYLGEAVKLQPNRVVHHLDLGKVYAAQGESDKARAEFALVAKLPIGDFNDPGYKAQAVAAMKQLSAK